MNTNGNCVQGRYTVPLPTRLSARWGRIFDVFRSHQISFAHITEAVLSIVYLEDNNPERSEVLNSHWETVIDAHYGADEIDTTDAEYSRLMDAFYSAVDMLEKYYRDYRHVEPFCYGEYLYIDSIWESEDADGIVMDTTINLREMQSDDREDLIQLHRTSQHRRSFRKCRDL